MCKLTIEGSRVVMDCASCPLEFTSPKCINSFLKDLSTTSVDFKTMRFEEEIIVNFNTKKTKILMQYVNFIKKLEQLMIKNSVYGLKEDPYFQVRKKTLKNFYDYCFMNPLIALNILKSYSEPLPERIIFEKGKNLFESYIRKIAKTYESLELVKLTNTTEDLKNAFLSLTGLKSMLFISSIILDVPKNAKKVKTYTLDYGINVSIYERPGSEDYLYVQHNPIIENLPKELQSYLKLKIESEMKFNFENVDFTTIFETKSREYTSYFYDICLENSIKITREQAIAMGREAASWVVGLGSPIENLSLDRDNITDIYIDSQNSPIYIEHGDYGLCHTLYRYNQEMLEHAFQNIMLTQKGIRRFDAQNPVVDVVLTRVNMRCHLQRPPATFNEYQAALRIMRSSPFTYSQYLFYHSFTPFFTGYDDTLVSLGASEAVLGVKGVGKTSFTSAKIAAIGTKTRILPIQDIEEIPTKAYRKRGFHIGAMRVQASDREGFSSSKELDLVSMANASLRMGDSALIINEIRSKTAIQGVINLLNTQPGVFLLYNLHAESLQDIQDRLELVFGIPGASMFATDRYSFLKKAKFGRKGRIYRVLGAEYETDKKNKVFKQIFKFKRGHNINSSTVIAKFIKNKEASSWDYDNLDFRKLENNLDIEFIPPFLERKSDLTGIPAEQYILQSFYKGKVYNDIYKLSIKLNDPLLRELDFVLKCNAEANKILTHLENENGLVDFTEAQKQWSIKLKEILKNELKERKLR